MAEPKKEKQPGYLYRRGEVWWGRVRMAGKEHRRSLRTEDRDEAAKRLDHWRKKIEREQFGMIRIAPGQWVYFVHDRDLNAIKVGVSIKVNRRFHALKCNTASEVVLLGSIEGTPEMEAVFHRFLTPFHRKGEWFQANEVVMRFVAALIELDMSDGQHLTLNLTLWSNLRCQHRISLR
jgi:hypothetical protein